MDEGKVDGFNLLPVDQPGTLCDFVDLVVPELQRRGRMRTSYPIGNPTLRELYAGGGNARIVHDHPAHQVSIVDQPPARAVGTAG